MNNELNINKIVYSADDLNYVELKDNSRRITLLP